MHPKRMLEFTGAGFGSIVGFLTVFIIANGAFGRTIGVPEIVFAAPFAGAGAIYGLRLTQHFIHHLTMNDER